jgi:hypothetical protein
MKNFLPGTIVRISNLQKASWYLYKRYMPDSPLLICPCHCKKNIPLIVMDQFDNGVVLLQLKNSSSLTKT